MNECSNISDFKRSCFRKASYAQFFALNLCRRDNHVRHGDFRSADAFILQSIANGAGHHGH